MSHRTEKTAEQVNQEKADAFEYGMGKYLRKIGVKTAEEVQFFMKAAEEVARVSQEKKKD